MNTVGYWQVHDKNNLVRNQHLHHLAWGPKKKVHTWPIYFVNSFKFHTEDWSYGKKTINCGVCVKGDDGGADENYYYGIIKEIVQVEYPGEPTKRLVLLNCEWFDVAVNRGVKVHPQYGIVEINHRRRYKKYDPFIIPTNAIQVYYVPYPEKIKEKVDWWVVIKTKPRGTVDDRYALEVAYQDLTTNVDSVANGDVLCNLGDEGEYEELETIIEVAEGIEDEDEDEYEDVNEYEDVDFDEEADENED